MFTPSQPTVLLVDDDPALLELFSRWLADVGDVTTASDAAGTVDMLAAADVCFLDRRLARTTGDDLLREARERGVDTVVSFLSGETPDVDLIGLGVDAYLTKPVTAVDLQTAAIRLARRADLDDDRRRLLATATLRVVLEESGVRLDESDAFAALVDELERRRAALRESPEAIAGAEWEAFWRSVN